MTHSHIGKTKVKPPRFVLDNPYPIQTHTQPVSLSKFHGNSLGSSFEVAGQSHPESPHPCGFTETRALATIALLGTWNGTFYSHPISIIQFSCLRAMVPSSQAYPLKKKEIIIHISFFLKSSIEGTWIVSNFVQLGPFADCHPLWTPQISPKAQVGSMGHCSSIALGAELSSTLNSTRSDRPASPPQQKNRWTEVCLSCLVASMARIDQPCGRRCLVLTSPSLSSACHSFCLLSWSWPFWAPGLLLERAKSEAPFSPKELTIAM